MMLQLRLRLRLLVYWLLVHFISFHQSTTDLAGVLGSCRWSITASCLICANASLQVMSGCISIVVMVVLRLKDTSGPGNAVGMEPTG
jgi:hypothetical protein